MNLYPCASDVVGVIAIQPHTYGLVLIIAYKNIGVKPILTAGHAHVTHPATLGAVGPSQRNVCNAYGVVTGNELEIGGLLAATFISAVVCYTLIDRKAEEGTRFYGR